MYSNKAFLACLFFFSFFFFFSFYISGVSVPASRRRLHHQLHFLYFFILGRLPYGTGSRTKRVSVGQGCDITAKFPAQRKQTFIRLTERGESLTGDQDR